MESFIAWLIASPIGAALIGAAVDKAVSEIKSVVSGLEKQVADHKATIELIEKNFAKLEGIKNETSPSKIDRAIDDALSHL